MCLPFSKHFSVPPPLQAHGSPGAFWESEQESLLFVIEMKSERVQEQSRKLQHMDALVNRLLFTAVYMFTCRENNSVFACCFWFRWRRTWRWRIRSSTSCSRTRIWECESTTVRLSFSTCCRAWRGLLFFTNSSSICGNVAPPAAHKYHLQFP